MNILLTGSGGFIGKNLKTYLQDKYTLLTPRSSELDLCNKQAVKEYFTNHSIDFIIHCGTVGGARGIADKDTTVEDNLAMVNNLIACKNENVRILLFGSGAMYGKDRNLHKVKESEIGNYIPKDLYGQSKLEIAKIVKNREDITCLNIFACYGYGEKESRFPSYAINQVLQGKDIEINQNVVFDYLWVEDMARIVEHFICHKPSHKLINITPSQSNSLVEIAEIVKNIKKKDTCIQVKNPVLNNEYTGDNAVLLQEIQGFHFVSIKEGLKKLYFYNKNLFKYGGE